MQCWLGFWLNAQKAVVCSVWLLHNFGTKELKPLLKFCVCRVKLYLGSTRVSGSCTFCVPAPRSPTCSWVRDWGGSGGGGRGRSGRAF